MRFILPILLLIPRLTFGQTAITLDPVDSVTYVAGTDNGVINYKLK